MIIGVYGDVHLTKNMRTLQDEWNTTAMKSIYHMYDKFDELNVESVVCLGDFFDAPRLEAKHMQLVLPILENINNRTYPTYILLGNHEAESEDSNILEFINTYDNIIPVTSLADIEGMLFVPYHIDPNDVKINSDHIVFTHHDIYGSELASGKTKAFFGIDPDIFSNAKLVMNGHVHLKSKVRKNLLNAGSILISQQGELKVGEYPSYYKVDTKTGEYESYDNEHSLIYLTANISDTEKIKSKGYDLGHLVLRLEYSGELPESTLSPLHISYRKLVEDIGASEEIVIHKENFDMRNYLINYIKEDQEVSENDKESYVTTGLELLG